MYKKIIKFILYATVFLIIIGLISMIIFSFKMKNFSQEKGLIAEARFLSNKLSKKAYLYYKKDKNTSFPCSELGWICASSHHVCDKTFPYIFAKKTTATKLCRSCLSFMTKNSYRGQYCYRSSEKGQKAKFDVLVTDKYSCSTTPVRLIFSYNAKEFNGFFLLMLQRRDSLKLR